MYLNFKERIEMKERLLKVCALLLAVVIVVCAAPVVTVEAVAGGYGTQPTTYSKQYNSGMRDVWCTTLSGTSASSYYTGSDTYENLSSLSQSSLKSSLSTLMRNTHSQKTSYDDCHNKANRTDCQNEDGTVVLLYTSYVAKMSDWISGSTGWNREHVWPESLGGDTHSTGTGGSDLHHIRPDDNKTNSTRGNKKFGEVSSGSQANGSSTVGGMSGGTYNSSYFEPHDNVKGDVARICLYVYVRWGADWGADSITEVFQSVDVLLDWMELDPVDTWEMGRNEVVQDIQGNRNVFIDYPEYAWLLFDEEIPEDMVTPSGMASNGTSGGGSAGGNTGGGSESEPETEPDATTCEHIVTKLVGWEAGNCTNPGYSGDTYCATCDTKLFSGIVTDPTGEHIFGEWSHGTGTTIEVRECEVCDHREEREYTGSDEESENVTDTATDTVTETDTETDTETVTEADTETDTEAVTETDTETQTDIATESESETEYPEKEDPEMPETGAETATEAVEDTREGETEGIALSGCGSSIAGGTVAVSVISIAAFLTLRKKKD